MKTIFAVIAALLAATASAFVPPTTFTTGGGIQQATAPSVGRLSAPSADVLRQ